MPETETITPRIDWPDFQKLVPEMATGMAAINHALRNSTLEPELRELIKIRASQLNGCAFCIQFHLNEARKIPVAAPKLDLLPAWRETTIYSPREAAALAFTERITLISGHPIEDEAWVEVRTHFSEAEVALLTTAIGQINFWNRIAAPLRFTPPIAQSLSPSVP
jgi:AhpD family alkylhydroperoxidase